MAAYRPKKIPAALNIENLGDAEFLIPGTVFDSQATGVWKEIKAIIFTPKDLFSSVAKCVVTPISDFDISQPNADGPVRPSPTMRWCCGHSGPGGTTNAKLQDILQPNRRTAQGSKTKQKSILYVGFPKNHHNRIILLKEVGWGSILFWTFQWPHLENGSTWCWATSWTDGVGLPIHLVGPQDRSHAWQRQSLGWHHTNVDQWEAGTLIQKDVFLGWSWS